MKNFKIILMCCVSLCLMAGEIFAYVMPLDQILTRVQKRFATINSLIIEQATHVVQSRDPLRERVFREKVWLKTPRYERTELMAASRLPKVGASAPKAVPGNSNEAVNGEKLHEDQEVRQPNRDVLYRWLLMASAKGELSAFLSEAGIQIWDLGYDRCDGVVAYRVGARDPDSPKLLVDKERFFPLLLSYALPGDPKGRLVTVRFKDYRKDDAGWYPYEIEYALKDAPTEEYHILNLAANAPIQVSFFERKIEPPPPPPKGSVRSVNEDDQRLKAIMRSLQKKYQ
ncbi:MAG: hypothetical protein K9N10_19845 [Deltaproteobacteria bacterium]|nr:hypothetical protein [Deltaproteobacteria bacterium]